MANRNVFIAVDGIDRSGKTTLVLNLKNKILPEATILSLPDRETKSGKRITQYLQGKIDLSPSEVSKLFFCNIVEFQHKLEKTLEETPVICDRYLLSNKAYDLARGIKPHKSEHLIQPDINFLIRIDEEECSLRKEYGKEILENLDFQRKVNVGFRRLYRDDLKMISGNEDQLLKEAKEFL